MISFFCIQIEIVLGKSEKFDSLMTPVTKEASEEDEKANVEAPEEKATEAEAECKE